MTKSKTSGSDLKEKLETESKTKSRREPETEP